jgi:hypothetical protein
MGHALAQLVEALRYKPEGLSASNKNTRKYQEHFLGVQVAGE